MLDKLQEEAGDRYLHLSKPIPKIRIIWVEHLRLLIEAELIDSEIINGMLKYGNEEEDRLNKDFNTE